MLLPVLSVFVRRVHVTLCVEFSRACEQSTDFHFASLEHQFELIAECMSSTRNSGRLLSSKPVTMTTAAAADADVDKMSTKSSASSASDEVRECDSLLSSLLCLSVPSTLWYLL